MENNSLEHILIVIPARLNSTRLPYKVLADIGGKTMLHRVLEQCKKAIDPSKIVLCTDNKKCSLIAKKLGIKALLTSESCASGTDRIASVLDNLLEILLREYKNKYFDNIIELKKRTLIINVQGDQPFLDPKVIKEMCCSFYSHSETPEVVTPIFKLKKEEIHNPSIVKVLINQNFEAIYFSRSALPHVRDVGKDNWHLNYRYWGHVGIYGYRGDILSKWEKLPKSRLEQMEKLEQLRLIDAGIKVTTFKVEGDFLSIDTQNQLDAARNLLK